MIAARAFTADFYRFTGDRFKVLEASRTYASFSQRIELAGTIGAVGFTVCGANAVDPGIRFREMAGRFGIKN